MEWLLLLVYGIFIIFLFFYSLTQLHLVLLSHQYRSQASSLALPADESTWPPVTVQLPVYNEKYVIERLIHAVAAFQYPADKLEIQVLDDSNDETTDLAQALAEKYRAQGLNLQVIRRPQREGYKAGALGYGLNQAKGDFFAIFDADFVPPPDFLLKTLPHFQDPQVGLVQTRWEHLNQDYSLLTHLQAFALNAHFFVEQSGRRAGRHFLNFNGTGGVWRKACIEDAGGWQSDTLTEDLDLSYRAQLKGWKFEYRPDIGTPAELPVEMNALKSQQYRWTKGAAECARKHLKKVLSAKDLPFISKIHAFFHLANSFVFISVLMLALLSLPILWVKNTLPQYQFWFQLASFFLLSFGILGLFYGTSEWRQLAGRFRFFPFLRRFLLFLSLSMGLSLHNALAVAEGYLGRKSPFVRTPKFNIQKRQDHWRSNVYRVSLLSPLTFLEAFLTLYFVGGLGMAFYFGDFGLFPFHLLLAFGFGYIVFYTWYHS